MQTFPLASRFGKRLPVSSDTWLAMLRHGSPVRLFRQRRIGLSGHGSDRQARPRRSRPPFCSPTGCANPARPFWRGQTVKLCSTLPRPCRR